MRSKGVCVWGGQTRGKGEGKGQVRNKGGKQGAKVRGRGK